MMTRKPWPRGPSGRGGDRRRALSGPGSGTAGQGSGSAGRPAAREPVTTRRLTGAGTGGRGTLGTIRQPDGLTRLTFDGKPPYTFRLDQAPGQAHGNNFSDRFGGTSFTWRVVTAPGQQAGTSGSPAQARSGGCSHPGGGSPG